MITTAIRKALPYIFIGLIVSLGIMLIFGGNPTFLTKIRITDNIYVYELDTKSYFENINLNFENIKSIPNRFINFDNANKELSQDPSNFLNVLKILGNCLIWILNLMLIPMNFAAWLVQLLLALIGIRQTTTTQWIYGFFTIIRNTVCPYFTT